MSLLDHFCKYCIHWEFRFSRLPNGRFGNCEQPTVNSYVQKDEMNQVDIDDGSFYTNENFGCIYFRKSEMVVTKLEENDESE